MSDLLPCPAWVWSNNSNVHCAKDRSWFGDDYRPLDTFLSTLGSNNVGTRVIGVGTVEIPVKLGSDDATAHGILRLPKVLHTPSFICNVIGNPILKEHIVSQDEFGSWTVTDRQGQNVAYLDYDIFALLRISEPPIGPRLGPFPFDRDPMAMYWINAFWCDEERDKIMPDLAPCSP